MGGFTISAVGIFIYRGMYFGLYDTLKPLLLGKDAGVGISFLLGWAVTVTAGLMSYPIDTVRRRMMMTSGGGKVQGIHGLLHPGHQERGLHVPDERCRSQHLERSCWRRCVWLGSTSSRRSTSHIEQVHKRTPYDFSLFCIVRHNNWCVMYRFLPSI